MSIDLIQFLHASFGKFDRTYDILKNLSIIMREMLSLPSKCKTNP